MVAVSSAPAVTLGNLVLLVEMVAVKTSVSSKTLSLSIVIFTAAEVLPGGNVTEYGPAW